MIEKCFKIRMFMIFSLFWILCWKSSVSSKELPLALKNLRCPLAKLDECFEDNANKAIPLVAKGDPEYGIPNMIPLKIPFMSIISNPSMSMNFTGVEVHGLDKMKIVGHKIDNIKHLYIVDLKGDNITVVGNYEADGRILVMPLNGKGRFKLYFKNGRYKSTSTVLIKEKEGEKYFNPIETQFQARFEKLIIRFDDLFEGNKILGEQVNDFLNENWETLLAEFGPSVEKTVAKIIQDIFVNLGSVVSFKNFYT